MERAISIQLLGGACLRSNDQPLSGPPAQRHRIALLTLIVASWPQPLARDRAMALLWPEREVASARRLLNLAVHVLRSALGDDVIVTTTGDALLFNPGGVRCDLHELRVSLANHADDDVARLYGGPLLDGFHLAESSEFEYWLDERRTELTHGYVGALRAVALHQEQTGDAHGLVGTCRRLVASDPYSSAHAMALMRALDAAGDRAAAIQHASEYAQRLRAELDLEPESEVLALEERLRRAPPGVRRSAPAIVRRQPARPRVAVLPFLNLGAEPEDACFADGITEDVIAQLSKIRALQVIARASVMPFTQRQRNLAAIGASLGATVLLDGSIRHAGDRVRIVATLIDVATDRHLWAETYDRRLTDVLAIQSDVALHIASALEAELSADEETRVRRPATADVQAHQLFLQGRQWMIKYTPDALRRAIELFEAAIARDEAFALAWTHVATASVELMEQGGTAPELAHRRAMEATARALALDPDLSAAHCSLGHLKTVRELDWEGAEREFKRALELSPSNADAYDLYGRLCAALGRYDEAIELHHRAQELDPLAHRLDVVTTLIRAGRYDEAIARGLNALELEPNQDRARATVGWAYFLSGRRDDGLRELERAVAVSPANTLWLGQLGEAYGLVGDTAKAGEILRELEERSRYAYVSPYHLAYVHIGLGDSARALDLLERAVAERTGPAYGIKGSFLLAPLHDHPRFRGLLRQMRLA